VGAATAIVWFRRDLRLSDLPTLLAAAGRAERALALFVLDQRLLEPSGAPRRTFLYRCLRELDDALQGRLMIVRGDPVVVLPQVALAVDARTVHISADYGPYGGRRDAAVGDALGDVELVATGSPYAVAPGRVVKANGEAYRVFTPFRRSWYGHGWHTPADTSESTVDWIQPPSELRVPIPEDDDLGETALPAAGERGARGRWKTFCDEGVDDYRDTRDRPDVDGTSRMSVHLKFGTVHPRTLLHDLRGRTGPGVETFRSELAWREFYADVLYRRPDSARKNYDRRYDTIAHDTGPAAQRDFAAWCSGRTGFPIVDAGMRQLLAEGWMHNRLRMIVASFLVKDLHVPWWWGARHFMTHLVDGDLASNQHGWQWTAGSGTDASPYFRVFNPTTQGQKFDPDGAYVRRWVPELRDVAGKAVHTVAADSVSGYPPPMVDHKQERLVALQRFGAITAE
jgi:deoxyribodipyrimidine photo-lyase